MRSTIRAWFRDHRIGFCPCTCCDRLVLLVRTCSMRVDDLEDYWYCRGHSEQYIEDMEEQWALYWSGVL